jgi:hypothetical protein
MSKWSILCLIGRSTGYLHYIEAGNVTFQIMVFVFVCSTWGIVELKTCFETWISRNDVYGVSFFHLSYLLKLMAYVCSQRITNVQIKYCMFDCSIYSPFVINKGWIRDSIQMIIFVNIWSTWSMVELKSRFQTWITRNYVNGVSLFHPSYLITLMAYLCSQWTPNVEIKYFMFLWSIYRLFVLNRVWKRDSFQIMLFINFSSTWSIVELKTRFEMWITRNDVNSVSFFHLSYLYHIRLTCAHKGHQMSKSIILCLIGRSTDYLW